MTHKKLMAPISFYRSVPSYLRSINFFLFARNKYDTLTFWLRRLCDVVAEKHV